VTNHGSDCQYGYDQQAALQIPVPQHRLTPLKNSWMEVYSIVTGNLKLDMRMNLKTRKVLLCAITTTSSHQHASIVSDSKRW
jgi:RNA-binding protein PNO1